MKKVKSEKSSKNSGKPVKGNATNKSKKKAIVKSASPGDGATSPSYKIHHILVEQIEVSKKRRQVHPEKVKDLNDSIATIGLRTPLTVRPLWGKKPLITGLHRLEAVKALGWKKVPCVYITGGEKVARLWEISENLHRAELTDLEEYEYIAEWLKLTEEDKPVSAQNGQKGKTGRPKGGLSEAARKLPGKGTEFGKAPQAYARRKGWRNSMRRLDEELWTQAWPTARPSSSRSHRSPTRTPSSRNFNG